MALVHAGSRYLQGGPCEGIEREAKGQRRFAGSLREIEPRQIQLHDAAVTQGAATGKAAHQATTTPEILWI